MARSLTPLQLAARFAAIAPAAAFLAAACGGFDTLSGGDASTGDAGEGSVVDASSVDGTTGSDGPIDAVVDTSVDRFVSDASDATAAMDAPDTSDARFPMDAADAADAM
ncbi:MAG: hypothetical protein M3O50_09180, partial [Myxococcota bacterium]|nr:hypothetical protein [Myxococcota bacterium]